MRSEIVTRAQAKARGLKRYFTGERCSQGHVAERSVGNWCCVECSRMRAREKYQRMVATEEGRRKVRDGEKGRRQRRYKKDPEKIREKNRRYSKVWRERGGEEFKAKKLEYYRKNREKWLEYARQYRAQHRDKYLAHSRQYGERVRDLVAVLRKEMPELLKEFGL